MKRDIYDMAEDAAQVLSSTALKEAFGLVEEGLLAQWKRSKTLQEREDCFYRMWALQETEKALLAPIKKAAEQDIFKGLKTKWAELVQKFS